MSKPERYREYG